MRSSPPRYVANFDSASAFLRGVGNTLQRKEHSMLGMVPTPLARGLTTIGDLLNRTPQQVRETLYILGGWGESISVSRIESVNSETLAQWVVGQYPETQYPAIAIGSSNGAAMHLWAAMGIPWLPQTHLVPVARSGIHPDEPRQDFEWGAEPGRRLLAANPDLQLHHMHDPNQDRLMIKLMTYFRVKRLRLGRTYREFIRQRLAPGGTLIVVDCELTWPATRIAERQFFQFGALGGADAEEFHQGSERVSAYLERYGSHRRNWDPPPPDGRFPEAEWGFEPALRADIDALAAHQGYGLRRLAFREPDHLSPLVADLYRQWNDRRGVMGDRLLVECFIHCEPYWTIRTGSTPFWMTFNKEPSAEALEKYLDGREPFDEILMQLFDHGVDSIGLVPIARWKRALQRARRRGEFVGVDEKEYPRDFAAMPRHYTETKDLIRARYPWPAALTMRELDTFIDANADRYEVTWESPAPVAEPAEAT
jgi:hypothetical protein